MNNHEFEMYVCPQCHAVLSWQRNALFCDACHQAYPVVKGIPDFVIADSDKNSNPFLHGFGKILAPLYEGPFWFPIMLKLLGGWHAPSLQEITSMACEKISSTEGWILDVATGTGTIGRHLAEDQRHVYGVDISQEMIERGQMYAARQGILNMHSARADAEVLPFRDGVFDACLFCGSLHIFPNTVEILQKVGRTLKKQAPVVVTTVIRGEYGIFSKKQKRQVEPRNMKVFELDELERMVSEAGFTEFKPEIIGCLILFMMRKQ